MTFGCPAGFSAPEAAQGTLDEIPVNVVRQSVPDEIPGDEIVHSDVLAEVKLPSTIRKSAQIHTQIHWH